MKKIKTYFLLILIAFILLMPEGSNALSSGGVGGYPAHPNPAIKYSESWFIYSLDLGESKEDAILLINSSPIEQGIKLYAVDSVASNQGNFALEDELDSRDGIGAWIKLSQSFVTLAPGETREIPFTISIPDNVDVGEHSGGIIIQKAQAGEISSDSGTASIVTRVGIRVYETVPGVIVKNIELLDFSVQEDRTSKTPFYNISLVAKNTSNISLKPQVNVHISGWGKIEYFKYSKFTGGLVVDFRDLSDFFKGETLSRDWQLLRGQKVSTRWEWPRPRFGRFIFQAELAYDDNGVQKLLKTKEVVITIIPWVEVAVLFGAIILLALFIILKRKIFGVKRWKKYTVKKGDQLAVLAMHYGVNWKKLAKANRLKSPLLKAGQSIFVPQAKASSKISGKKPAHSRRQKKKKL